MTVKELYSVQADMNKLKSLSMELSNLECFNPYKGNVITDMPKGGGSKDMSQWYVEEKERIEGEIAFWKDQLKEDRNKVEELIDQAPYPEKEIIRFRVVNNMSWEDIGEIIGYSRRTVVRKFYNYIKLSKMPVLPVEVHSKL